MPIPGGGYTVHAVTVAELKTHLNITSTTHDTELEAHRDAAEQWVTAWRNGHMAYQDQVVETFDSDGSATLLLSKHPVDSITSVVESGTTLAATGYVVDSDGILTRLWASYTAGAWLAGVQNVTVTYIAGEDTQPARVKQAVLEVAAHLWESQRGGMTSVVGQGPDEWNPAQDFSIRRRLHELLGGQAGVA